MSRVDFAASLHLDNFPLKGPDSPGLLVRGGVAAAAVAAVVLAGAPRRTERGGSGEIWQWQQFGELCAHSPGYYHSHYSRGGDAGNGIR